jgi:hypothetical protein
LQTLIKFIIFAAMNKPKTSVKGSYNEIVAFVVDQRKKRGYSIRDIAAKYSRGVNTIVEFEKAATGGSYTNLKVLDEYCYLFKVKYSYLAVVNANS